MTSNDDNRQTSERWYSGWWNPEPVKPPEIHPQFDQLSHVVRVVEIMRFQLHKLFYAASPHGHLRELLKLILLAALIAGAALPVLWLILALLETLLSCLASIVGIILLGTFIIAFLKRK